MLPRFLLLLLSFTLSDTGHAQVILDSARFGYTGTITRYATLDDARSGTNALDISTVPQRDLGLTILADAPWLYSGYTNCNFVGTSWNYVSAADGRTPSNTNIGFVQLGDLNATTVTALTASWNTGLDTFTLHLAGANATNTNDYARLWNAPGTVGSWGVTSGNFISYELNLVASGLAASWEVERSTYSTYGVDPTAVSGNFSGLFQNTSPDDGYAYTFDLALNLTSWVYDKRNDLTNEGDPYIASSFATPAVIPEPATAVAVFGLATLGFALWRKARTRP